MAARLSHHFVGGLHRLDHLADLAHGILQRLATAQGQAQAAVARQVAGAGQHQIAEACQAHQRFRLGADRRGQAQHFVEAPGDQAGTGVEAQLHAIGHAGSYGQHVLHRAAQLGTDHVVAGVGAERRAVHRLGHRLRELGHVAVHGDRGRQALGHFLGERRPGNNGQRHVLTQHFARHFMQEAARTGLEALGGPGHAGTGRTQRRQRAHGFAERVRRGHHQDPGRTFHRRRQIGGGTQAVRQWNARQVARVLMALVDGFDHGRITPPQHGRVTVPCEQAGQRGSPGTGAEHGDLVSGSAHP
ncbi:hypothetical protein G6F68_010584 [Rhizopus microsporus]|nr:hypothetical protein G6F68_010584 [Rhizopus microsporus]